MRLTRLVTATATEKPCKAYASGLPCRDGRDHCHQCGRHLDGDLRCAKCDEPTSPMFENSDPHPGG